MQMKKYIKSFVKFLPLIVFLGITSVKAQTPTPAQPADSFPSWLNSDFYLIVCAMFFFLLMVIVLGNTGIHLSKAAAKLGKRSSATMLLLFASASTFAQTANDIAVAKPSAYFPKWADNPNV